ncbi:uncharacterized protein BX663DRAFT_525329 [Cokeromyces recurvatus]|uniref:uncharacterized protein n=1 Tax=Cokeromyces recurvatus TaxID=90255 RepID=UPI002220A952|nr:uncharacterized protein BX663DRAFT_525329 [Cokeromyces recurvatus]KAI7898290.1 hypothetical protein BX663DRAFT_525329 [Cokeromyces recurvatus]
MSDYKDIISKSVPLYHHEQVPFHSFSRQHTSSTMNNNNNNSFFNDSTETLKQEHHLQQANPITSELQDIIMSYQSQPDLLRLILLSKLEEDKRRAEEAKLRSKELDLLLTQQQMIHIEHHHDNSLLSSFQQVTPPQSSNSSTIDIKGYNSNNPIMMMRRTSFDAVLSSPTLLQNRRRESTIASSFTADSDEFDDKLFSPIPTSSITPVSTATATSTTTSTTITTNTPTAAIPNFSLQMESYNNSSTMEMMSLLDNQKAYNTTSAAYSTSRLDYEPTFNPLDINSELCNNLSSTVVGYDFPSKPRRRREMQAITKIVETREYPYIDGHFWKNNGNTIQKKTGNKSIYYKCSNSNKECPVNKTVTWKDHGEYLIKYRGDHLPDCNKVQRIVDV